MNDFETKIVIFAKYQLVKKKMLDFDQFNTGLLGVDVKRVNIVNFGRFCLLNPSPAFH